MSGAWGNALIFFATIVTAICVIGPRAVAQWLNEWIER